MLRGFGIAFVGAVAVLAVPAQARSGQTFVEVGVGGATTHAGSFEFINPNGGDYIKSFSPPPPGASMVVGNDIILYHQRRDSSSATAEASIGHFLTDSLFVRATYRYLGRYHFSGSAGFPIDQTGSVGFDQDFYLRAQGVYVGLGYEKTFGSQVFVDLSVEAGGTALHGVSTQGANVGDPFGHPPRTKTNFSSGGEIGLGVHLNRRLDLIVKGRGDWLGTAETGVSTAMVSADGNFGINPDEQLKMHKLSNFGAGLTLRARF
jgi:hypothetical protein